MSKTLQATSSLIGAVIGAGILGIPYVVMKSGFGIGMINLILVAIILMITILYLGEIALRTRKNHQLPGYAEKYLGKKGKLVMFISFAFGIYSATLAYIIGEADSLSHLFFNSSEYVLYFGIAFWAVMSVLSYFGIKALEEGEEIGIILIFILIISITVLAWNKIDTSNLYYNNPHFFFLPFGVMLFAFMGFAAIPEIERILGKERKLMKRTIITSYISVFIIYALFTSVSAPLNPRTTEVKSA
jgi:tyrosine-specific transport protein